LKIIQVFVAYNSKQKIAFLKKSTRILIYVFSFKLYSKALVNAVASLQVHTLFFKTSPNCLGLNPFGYSIKVRNPRVGGSLI